MAITTTGTKGTATAGGATGITISSWTLPADADFVVAALATEYSGNSAHTLYGAWIGENARTGQVQVTHGSSEYPHVALVYWLNANLPALDAAYDVEFDSDFADSHVAAVMAFKGVKLLTPVEATDTNTENDGNDLPIDYDITTVTDNAFIISAACKRDIATDTWTAEDSQTEIHDGGSNAINMVFGYVDAGTAGNKVQGWNPSDNARWLSCVAAIAVAAEPEAASGATRKLAGSARHGIPGGLAGMGGGLAGFTKVGRLFRPDTTLVRPRLIAMPALQGA